MANYNNNYEYDRPNGREQKDCPLALNEFAYVINRTNGVIKVYTGPATITISQQEAFVKFDENTKRFVETDFKEARRLFSSVPTGWYCVLKNPAKDNIHPESGKAMNSPELEVGKKINIPGPASFALFPGQMGKVIQGHRLRTNQYLIARVYDAEAANTTLKAEQEPYVVGQQLVIRGTETAFYMPPTGFEVMWDNDGGHYVRDAVTLERLEYAILLDENGNKRYMHGPAVVFPKPTETFVKANKGSVIFRALELSPISGIYVKVIAAYDDKNEAGKAVHHPVGEELFITGKEQMIYYPRPEHALIQYDGKYMHHGIAIPKGEGRYIMNRLTGDIKTVFGPAMYLPDPRTEVVVKRKLSEKECHLYYPGNTEVLRYNNALNEQTMEKLAKSGQATKDALNTMYSTSNMEKSLALFEVNSNISRGSSYTKPRTITLDTKFDGVVAIDVWSGYAIRIISKTGNRRVVVGPETALLAYDETLEVVKINGEDTVFLPTKNIMVSDRIEAYTNDNVGVFIDLTYKVNFNEDAKDNWFNIFNFTDIVKMTQRVNIKNKLRNYSVQEFYHDAAKLIEAAVLGENKAGYPYEENGMVINDIDVKTFSIERNVANMLNTAQNEQIQNNIKLQNMETQKEIIKSIHENEKLEIALRTANQLYKLEQQHMTEMDEMEKNELIKAKKRAAYEAEQQAQQELQPILDALNNAKLARLKAESDHRAKVEREKAELEKFKADAKAEQTAKIMASIAPGLIEALNANTNAEMLNGIGNCISPYALANGESIADTISTLLRGSKLEESLKNFLPAQQ